MQHQNEAITGSAGQATTRLFAMALYSTTGISYSFVPVLYIMQVDNESLEIWGTHYETT
jgi:hypothetical protein